MQGSILARFDSNRTENPGSEPRLPADTAKPPGRRWLWVLLVSALTAAVLWAGYQRWGRTFKWDVFVASFLELDWRWLAAACVLALVTYYGRALRWAVMLRPLGARPDYWDLFTATAVGFTATVLLGRPGEFVRPYLISVKERLPFSSQMAAWFLERICDLLAVLLVFGFALSQVQGWRADVGPGLQWVLQTGGYVVAFTATACIVLLVLFRQFSAQMRRRLLDALGFLSSHHHARADRMVTSFVEVMGTTRRHSSVLLLVFYTALEWVLITACYAALFRAYPATSGFNIQDILIFIGFVSFGSVVQIPGVGGGVQLVSVIVLTELFGLPLEVATSMAILIWVITFVVIVPFGLLLGVREGFNWKKVRELEKDAQL